MGNLLDPFGCIPSRPDRRVNSTGALLRTTSGHPPLFGPDAQASLLSGKANRRQRCGKPACNNGGPDQAMHPAPRLNQTPHHGPKDREPVGSQDISSYWNGQARNTINFTRPTPYNTKASTSIGFYAWQQAKLL